MEILLDDFTAINIAEDRDLLVNLVVFNFKHFPAEHHINVTLCALVQSNFICIRERVDEFVRGPVLDSGISGVSSLHLVLAHEVLVVKGVEVRTLSLVWHSWGVTDEITVAVSVSVVIVFGDGGLGVNSVNENTIAIVSGGHLCETLDVLSGMVKSRCKYERLVAELFAV